MLGKEYKQAKKKKKKKKKKKTESLFHVFLILIAGFDIGNVCIEIVNVGTGV